MVEPEARRQVRMERRQRASGVFDRDEVESVLAGQFYTPPVVPPVVENVERRPKVLARAYEKPAHYKVICISLYTSDLEKLDRMVEELKSRGFTKANRSALIRFALDQVDLDKVPRGL
jgi:hypothetical protein